MVHNASSILRWWFPNKAQEFLHLSHFIFRSFRFFLKQRENGARSQYESAIRCQVNQIKQDCNFSVRQHVEKDGNIKDLGLLNNISIFLIWNRPNKCFQLYTNLTELRYILKNITLTFFKLFPRTLRKYTATFCFLIHDILCKVIFLKKELASKQIDFRINFAKNLRL